jgi:hypothetical protein
VALEEVGLEKTTSQESTDPGRHASDVIMTLIAHVQILTCFDGLTHPVTVIIFLFDRSKSISGRAPLEEDGASGGGGVAR